MAEKTTAAPKTTTISSTIRFRSVMAGLRQTRKRAQAAKYLKKHVARFNKSHPEMVTIDPKLNDYLMRNSVKTGKEVKIEITKVGDKLNVKLSPSYAPATQKPPAPATVVEGKQGFPQDTKTNNAPQPRPAQVSKPQTKEEKRETTAEGASKVAKSAQQTKAQEKKQQFTTGNDSKPQPADSRE